MTIVQCPLCGSKFAEFYLPYCPNTVCKKYDEDVIRQILAEKRRERGGMRYGN